LRLYFNYCIQNVGVFHTDRSFSSFQLLIRVWNSVCYNWEFLMTDDFPKHIDVIVPRTLFLLWSTLCLRNTMRWTQLLATTLHALNSLLSYEYSVWKLCRFGLQNKGSVYWPKCPVQNVLGWAPCVQVTCSHLKCNRLVTCVQVYLY